MDRPDAELVEAACRGDLASFGVLYERHYRLAVAIARGRLADRHLAEDAAQEAFAIACRTLRTLRDRERFPHWLGTIVRRTASRLAADRPGHEALLDDAGRGDDPDLRALRQQVRDALELLEPTAREVVVLRYFGGFAYDEIARALDLSAASVHGHLQRARARLARALDAHDPSGARP